MKLLLITIVAVLIPATISSEELEEQWINFKRLYKRSYNRIEETKRLKIFKNNLEEIEAHNKQYEQHMVTYKMGLNQFADMTHEEYVLYASSYKYEYKNNTNDNTVKSQISSGLKIPDEIDWREKGAVTEVKNQGTCGSCWAFSVTGALEGQNFLKTGKLIPLSEQELIDCIIARKQRGCNGGVADDGYKYVMKHGLASEAEYPYEEEDGLCRRGSIPSSVTINGYVRVFGNEEALKEAVGTIGPIAVSMDASKWQFYNEGIFNIDDCLTDINSLNHAILAVGYGVENGTEYWLVKNSYGAGWGEKGYIRLVRNANNLCGIATMPSYPVV